MTTLRLLAAGLLLAAGSLGAQAPAGPSTTVIVVRHAEKAAEPAADPPLTEAGAARAAALVEAVRHAGVKAVISTQFARTRTTVGPAATALGLPVETADARARDHVAALAARILGSHRGSTVLVAGHSNTVPDIVAALGAPKPALICDGEYDNLYVVTIPAAGPATVVQAKYGAASARDETCREMIPIRK
jgi:broad specificity phosphatase PhoE